MADKIETIDDMDLDVLRRRLIYRASHRGTKELDFILGRYCKAHVGDFNRHKLAQFERLLEHQETHLQQWLMGQVDIPEGDEGDMLRHIRAYHLDFVRDESGLGDISHE